MADTKISALTQIDTVASDDEFALADMSAGPASKAASAAQVATFIKNDSLGLMEATRMGMNLP